MKTANKKDGGAYQPRSAFRVSPIAAGCAVFLSMTAGAYAQQAPATGDGASTSTVVVTGIRKGIEEAISVKKNSNSIVEAISAEDVGKLPDTSVAEAISRLPGVTAQRTRDTGKPAGISVRGLDPAFNGTTLNGREIASTDNGRNPSFDLFPAELIGNVLIYKTPDASLVNQGLSATIDMRTLQPLDFGKRTVAVNYRKERSGIQAGEGTTEGNGDHATFVYVDQFADRTLGVALGVTKFKDTGGGQLKFNSWGGWAPTVDYNGQQVAVPGGFGSDTEVQTDDHSGVSLALQYKPNKDFKTTFDVFHSEGKFTLKKTGLEGAICGSAGGYDPNGTLTNATIVNGVAASGTCDNYKGVVRNHKETTEDHLTALGWNAQLKVADWTLTGDLGHSDAVKHYRRFETTAGQPGNTPNNQLGKISWTGFNGSNFADVKYQTSLNYSDRAVAVLTDVDGWGGGSATKFSPQAGYVALPDVNDKVTSLRLTAQRDVNWGPITSTTYGINYTKRDKERAGQEGRLVINGDTTGFAYKTMPGSDTALAGPLGIPVAKWDPDNSLGSIYSLTPWVDASTLAKNWAVHEKVATVYAMGNLDSELAGFPYRGNVGLQVVHTNQESSGAKVDLATCTGITADTCPSSTVSDGTSYWNVLPSMNVAFDVGHDQTVRLGLAKQMSRPGMDDMRATREFGVKNSGPYPILTGSGGNPHLKPFEAKALDLSYEKYFGKKGYISVAGFYKKLDTYILNFPMVYDFKPYVSAGTPLPQTGPFANSTVGLNTIPVNGEGGSIHGFEFAVNVPFSLVTPMLDGFGAMVNFSDTTSAVSLPSSGFANIVSTSTIPLPGLSKQVTNARLYYEKYGLQVAVAARKRSDFLGKISDFQDNSQLTYVKGDTVVDLQVSYEFQGGPLKGLSVIGQVNNWTNTPYKEYAEDPNKVTYETKFGKQYFLGLNYKM